MDNSYYAIQTGSEQFVSLYSVFHDLKRHLVQEQFWGEEAIVCYENNKMTAIKLIQAFQCSNIPKLFIAKKSSNSGAFPQLAADQISIQKTVDRYLSGFTKPYNSHDRYSFGVPSSLNGLEQQAGNIYFEINDLITLLDRQSIPHPFRISVPKIPRLPRDAEDPQTNLIYKKPARLCNYQDGQSFLLASHPKKIRNKEGEETTLTAYIEYPRWTPAMAAMLTCGLHF